MDRRGIAYYWLGVIPTTPPPTPAPARSPRYDTLDVWRGGACLAVVLFHSVAPVLTNSTLADGWAAGKSAADWVLLAVLRCWAGVPVFFVISGYCIAAAADSARSRPRRGWSFFTRRFRRIYPPLWAYLLVMGVAVAALPRLLAAAGVPVVIPFPNPADVPLARWVGSVTLTEEWRHHFGGPAKGYFTGHIWSLCYEEQFYLVIGLLVALAPRWLFPATAAVTAGVGLLVVGAVRCPFPTDGFFFDGLWLPFAAGVGVYYRAAHATRIGRWCLDLALILGTIWAAARVTDWYAFPQTLPAQYLVAFPAAVLLAWLHPHDRATATWRVLAPLRWCGQRCYSLYLVHGPIAVSLSLTLYAAGVTTAAGIVCVTIPACVAASVLAGAAFYRLVEVRFHNPPHPAVTPARP